MFTPVLLRGIIKREFLLKKMTKKIFETIIIILISSVLIFGLVKIVAAPLNEFVGYLRFEKIEQNNTSLAVSKDRSIEFIFGGDVMLSRQVNSRMVKYEDYTWPFIKIADFLRSADLSIINLESPFVLANDYFVPTGSFMFKANPKALEGLVLAGIDLVSLANNHTLNQGREGLNENVEILKEKGIKYIGAGKDDFEAYQAEVFEINNKKFAFLAYAYPNDNSVAKEDSAGIATMDIDRMVKDVSRLKEEGNIVIVNMHAGIEYVTEPNWQQKDFAHAAIEAGAEAVIGHHPHWPQIIEIYQDKPIIYSLGNLVFDQMWSLETRQGLLAKMFWRDGWEKIEIVPIKIYDYGQPEIISDEEERGKILERIGLPKNGVIKIDK